MMSKRSMSQWILFGFLALSTACAPHFEIFTASDFAELGADYPYDFRAATPDGLVIGVREHEYDVKQGDLKFWSKAVKNELQFDRGYSFLGEEKVTTKKGLEGLQLRFGIDREDVAHEYLVTLFIVKKRKKMRVFVVEAGGREELVERHRAQIDWTVSEFIAR